MSGTRLKAFIITIRAVGAAPETFYVLAKDAEQASLRARGLYKGGRPAVCEKVAA